MQKPLVIEDGEFSWQISLTNDLDPGTYGTTENPAHDKNGLISIDADLPRFRFLHTALHELLHAAEFAEDCPIEDKVIDKAARYLARVFDQNPQLVKFLFGKGGKRADR